MIIKSDWKQTDYYNISTELNRVENNILELNHKFNSCGFFNSINTKTNWSIQDFLDLANINRIRQNINGFSDALNDVYQVDLPIINTNENQAFSFIQANEIEKPLGQLNEIIDFVSKNVLKCGSFSSGINRTSQMIRRI